MSRKLVEPTIQVKGRIPASLVRDVRILLLDPKTTLTAYGSLSALMTKLFSDWVDEMRKNPGELLDGSSR